MFVSYFTAAVGYVSEKVFVYGDIFGMHTAFHELPNRNWRLFVNEISFSRILFLISVDLCVCLSLSLSFVNRQIPTVFVVVFQCALCMCDFFSMEITSTDLFSCMELLSNNCNHLLK